MIPEEKMEATAQLTLAVSAGVGLGLLVGMFLFRRKTPSIKTLTPLQEEPVSNFVSEEFKMIFVVNNELKMGKGKVAAQVGHATVGAYKQMLNTKILSQWEMFGQMKVVVKAPDQETFIDVARAARTAGLNTYMVHDAGRTQIAPGSKTVLGIGPGPAQTIDQVTGHLKLY